MNYHSGSHSGGALIRADAVIPKEMTYLPDRASDQHRADTASHLTSAHVAGFIDVAEFEARHDLALAAKTRPQLQALTSDLPPPPISKARSALITTGKVADSRPGGAAMAWLGAALLGGWLSLLVETAPGNVSGSRLLAVIALGVVAFVLLLFGWAWAATKPDQRGS